MAERCNYQPVLNRAGRDDLSCTPQRAASYRDKGLCDRCPRVTQARVVASDFMTSEQRIGDVAARAVVLEGIYNSNWGKRQSR